MRMWFPPTKPLHFYVHTTVAAALRMTWRVYVSVCPIVICASFNTPSGYRIVIVTDRQEYKHWFVCCCGWSFNQHIGIWLTRQSPVLAPWWTASSGCLLVSLLPTFAWWITYLLVWLCPCWVTCCHRPRCHLRVSRSYTVHRHYCKCYHCVLWSVPQVFDGPSNFCITWCCPVARVVPAAIWNTFSSPTSNWLLKTGKTNCRVAMSSIQHKSSKMSERCAKYVINTCSIAVSSVCCCWQSLLEIFWFNFINFMSIFQMLRSDHVWGRSILYNLSGERTVVKPSPKVLE